MLSHEEGTLFSQAPFPSLSAVNTGGYLLQIRAAAQRRDRGRLTEESAISLRVWSDPTAKMILPSGEMATQL